MSNFDKYAYAGKCDVCGKQTRVVTCASALGPVSIAYCEECLTNGAEPYNFIVAYIACVGEWPADVAPETQTRVRKMLAFHNKTEAEFCGDVAALQKSEVQF